VARHMSELEMHGFAEIKSAGRGGWAKLFLPFYNFINHAELSNDEMAVVIRGLVLCCEIDGIDTSDLRARLTRI